MKTTQVSSWKSCLSNIMTTT